MGWYQLSPRSCCPVGQSRTRASLRPRAEMGLSAPGPIPPRTPVRIARYTTTRSTRRRTSSRSGTKPAKLIDLGCEQLLARPADIQLCQQLLALRQDDVFVQPEAGVRAPQARHDFLQVQWLVILGEETHVVGHL